MEAKPRDMTHGQVHAQDYLRELRQRRHDALAATIPIGMPEPLEEACRRYVRVYVENLGRRGLARAYLPWTYRPQVERVKRGNPRRNPTALK